jgi:hypothetical protein
MSHVCAPSICSDDPLVRAAIESTLRRFGPGAARVAYAAGIRIVALRRKDGYRDQSRALRRLAAGVDDRPIPPAGLFIVEERTTYLRSFSPMTVAPELVYSSCNLCKRFKAFARWNIALEHHEFARPEASCTGRQR